MDGLCDLNYTVLAKGTINRISVAVPRNLPKRDRMALAEHELCLRLRQEHGMGKLVKDESILVWELF